MPLVLDGSNGVSGVDGTAANPSIEGTDSNTGIFFPAADTIAFAEGGAEVARFDSAGNFGIGTSSPLGGYRLSLTGSGGLNIQNTGASDNSIVKYSNSGRNWYAGLRGDTSNAWALSDDSAFRMVVDTSGNVGIGGTPLYKLDVIGTVSGGNHIERIWNAGTAASTQSILQIATGASSERYVNLAVNHTAQYLQNAGIGITTLYQDYDTQFFRNIAGTVRASIDTSGNFAFNSGYGSAATAYGCRVWIRFTVSGGTPSISASGNVTSITDNGVGDFTFNFTTAMPDTNYAFVGLGTGGGANYQIPGGSQGNGTTLSTGSLRTQFGWVSNTSGSLTNQDPNAGYISIFR